MYASRVYIIISTPRAYKWGEKFLAFATPPRDVVVETLA